MSHPALTRDFVAVVTGGAAGIGLAAATKFARLGLRVCIADLDEDRLSRAAEMLAAAAPGGTVSIMTRAADVGRTWMRSAGVVRANWLEPGKGVP